ncbi:MAG: 23S rRNA (pseudouridine(1915)-N(3))-methyltransferase RlmH [Clostridiales bacterium]|nr:23S rRNA (pseudouridine(1915)-N(3))-methyltransferase RlmH [Clostridiales bacterium]
MLKINIVAVGKVKEPYFLDGINEYIKRIGKYGQVSHVEVAEENFNKVDDGMIKTILDREAERIKPHLKGYVFAMAIEGKKLSSVDLAKKLKVLLDAGNGVITFVIGGSYGLSGQIKSQADALLSFSDMTFPHTLFRLMLTEQIYRALSINANSSYHK